MELIKTRGGVHLIQTLDALTHVVSDGGQGGHNGGAPKPMSDHREVGEVPLDVGVEDGLGPGVTQGASVLVQEIHKLFTNKPARFRSTCGNVKCVTNLVARRRSFQRYMSACCLVRYSATGLAGNSVSQT